MQPLVTPEDHDAGFMDMPVQYRRGAAPEGLPDTIRVRALSWIELAEVNRAYAADGKMDTGSVWALMVTLTALPAPHNTPEFLNRLKPASANQIVSVATTLACGVPDEDAKKNETPAMASGSSAPDSD